MVKFVAEKMSVVEVSTTTQFRIVTNYIVLFKASPNHIENRHQNKVCGGKNVCGGKKRGGVYLEEKMVVTCLVSNKTHA